MDDEAKELLREIRDALSRQEDRAVKTRQEVDAYINDAGRTSADDIQNSINREARQRFIFFFMVGLAFFGILFCEVCQVLGLLRIWPFGVP